MKRRPMKPNTTRRNKTKVKGRAGKPEANAGWKTPTPSNSAAKELQLPYSLGQGMGETPTPSDAQRSVQNVMNQVKR